MTKYLINLVILMLMIVNVSSLKILVVFPLPVRSHYILGNELGKGLAKLGNDVTILSAYKEENPPKNYKEIVLNELAEKKESQKNKYNMFEMENISPYFQLMFLCSISSMITEIVFNSTKVQDLLKSDENFDIVIVEQFWNDAMKAFAYHYDAHSVVFSTVGPTRWVNNLVANPENPSYIPDILLSFNGEMSFFERAYNLIFGLVSDLVLYSYVYPTQNSLLKQYFPKAPHLSELQSNVSLVLTNSHESINSAVPHVPNMIDIGGYHVNPPKELPEYLKEFMDNSKQGVIYFSLGSNLQPSTMPKEKKDIILKVLGSRKEKVLWKWDEDQLENKPSNVMISKWFPQQAILAHPNCKLFISHGGLLSLTESVYLGVPVLAFPIFGDQKLNAARIKSKGFGLTLPFSQINKKDLTDSLNEILENPMYRENALRSSRIMHDRPVKPIELADYWIKYIAKHGGAPHLRVSGINLPFYKYYMLDIIAVFFIIIFILKFSIVRICQMCFKKCNCSTKSKKE